MRVPRSGHFFLVSISSVYALPRFSEVSSFRLASRSIHFASSLVCERYTCFLAVHVLCAAHTSARIPSSIKRLLFFRHHYFILPLSLNSVFSEQSKWKVRVCFTSFLFWCTKMKQFHWTNSKLDSFRAAFWWVIMKRSARFRHFRPVQMLTLGAPMTMMMMTEGCTHLKHLAAITGSSMHVLEQQIVRLDFYLIQLLIIAFTSHFWKCSSIVNSVLFIIYSI